ncbi:glycosyltransferase [Actinokineospora auranticolor]|uniref:MGT family glycosyltransferase n=1 Tax=Actinokineospora auranticolor TaxID=155976 RepID=A0A2S6H1H2_9PSEU|nr:nucleotide disphospho-sugar-binding domain-containing protein [Actinokineospora auranticolor]PPK71339.1 MGT family glycosyltransferase [Actinokineospora auranticolor]
MRVMFVSLASVGHAYPMVPFAAAVRAAGHEVRFAVGEEVHAPLASVGLRPFRPADVFYEVYAEDLEPELDRWRPDAVVHGWGVPEAGVAARRAGVPGLWHGFGRMFPEGIGLVRPVGGTHLDICPPSLQDKGFEAERVLVRPVPFAPGEFSVEVPGRPLVYVTLGTAFGTADVLRVVVAGLGRVDAQVVVATGRVPVAEVGPLPGNVIARSWVGQAEVLRHASAVVHHAGSGTTLGALAVGVPQVVLPQGADQFANAEALVAAGVAVRPGEVTAEAVADAVAAVLTSPDLRAAAGGIAEEIRRMPGPEEIARRLPDLIAD